MKTISFYADDEDIRLIRDEQMRLAALGGSASESEAIRTFITRAAAAGNGTARADKGARDGAKRLKFQVLPGGKALH